MVKIIFYLLGFSWFMVLRAAPLVDASVDSMNSQAHFPLQGTITITHSKEEKIDSQSFRMEGKSVEASFVKDVKMSTLSDTFVSIYNFQLPAQDKGSYILPSISVKIGNQIYHSTPSPYEVNEQTSGEAATPLTQSSSPVVFRLEAFVEGPSVLYPGERTQFHYRISYNRSIDLTRSELPLIHPSHFQKIGDVQIQDHQLQNMTVQDLIQEVEASEIGTFSFGPSLIEGYAYTTQNGQKVYDSTLLKSETPLITLEVKPFPRPVEPVSFTGGLGRIQVEAQLTSSQSVVVGDLLQLQMKVEGVNNLEDLYFPPLECQPGFSGFFQLSDFPPLAEVKKNAKFFYLELRPLNSLISKIPSIAMSSFDPIEGKYVNENTSSIPIQVAARPLENKKMGSIPIFSFPSIDHWPTPLFSPLKDKGSLPLELQQKKWRIKEAFIFWMIPFGILLLFLQKYLYIQWLLHSKPQIPKSEELFKLGLKKTDLQLLEQAFWNRLWEKKIISGGTFYLDKLPQETKFEALRIFLFQLQALQYSHDKQFDSTQLKQEAKRLFNQL